MTAADVGDGWLVDKASSNWSSVLIAFDASELRTVASSSDCDRGDTHTQGNGNPVLS